MDSPHPTKSHARTAATSYAEHATATKRLLSDALERISANAQIANDRPIGWADVADASRLREMAVRLAWVAGTISAQEAKDDHGVSV